MNEQSTESNQEMADRIRAVIASKASLDHHGDLIDRYRKRTSEVNARVSNARSWLVRGLLPEAIDASEAYPDAVDAAAHLDLGRENLKLLAERCGLAAIEIPTGVNIDAARDLSNAYPLHWAVSPELRTYRRLCLLGGGVGERLRALDRACARAATFPDDQFAKAVISVMEGQRSGLRALRLKEIMKEGPEAMRTEHARRMVDLGEELRSIGEAAALEPDAEQLRKRLFARADALAVKTLGDDIDRAMFKGDPEALRETLAVVDGILHRKQVTPPPEVAQKCADARKRLAAYDDRAQKNLQKKKLESQLRELLDRNAPWAELAPYDQMTANSTGAWEESLLVALGKRREDHVAELQAAQFKKSMKVLAGSCGGALVIALAAFGGWWWVDQDSTKSQEAIATKDVDAALANRSIPEARAVLDKAIPKVRYGKVGLKLQGDIDKMVSDLAKQDAQTLETAGAEAKKEAVAIESELGNQHGRRRRAALQSAISKYTTLIQRLDSSIPCRKELERRKDELQSELVTIGRTATQQELQDFETAREIGGTLHDVVARYEAFAAEHPDSPRTLSLKEVLKERDLLERASETLSCIAAWRTRGIPNSIAEATQWHERADPGVLVGFCPGVSRAEAAELGAYFQAQELRAKAPASSRIDESLEMFKNRAWGQLKYLQVGLDRVYTLAERATYGETNGVLSASLDLCVDSNTLFLENKGPSRPIVMSARRDLSEPVLKQTADAIVAMMGRAKNGELEPLTVHLAAAQLLREAQMPAPLKAYAILSELESQALIGWPDQSAYAPTIDSLKNGVAIAAKTKWTLDESSGRRAADEVELALKGIPNLAQYGAEAAARVGRIRSRLLSPTVVGAVWRGEPGDVRLRNTVTGAFYKVSSTDGSPRLIKVGVIDRLGAVTWNEERPVDGTPLLMYEGEPRGGGK